jgi:hypothetical protein
VFLNALIPEGIGQVELCFNGMAAPTRFLKLSKCHWLIFVIDSPREPTYTLAAPQGVIWEMIFENEQLADGN